MAERRRLFGALVVRGPAALEIDGLRRGLGSKELERLPPHLTLLAPINLLVEDLPRAGARFSELARLERPFALELGPPQSFAPASPVLYLSVSAAPDELARLKALHRALASGVLAPPVTRADRDFVAHVTIANRVTVDVLEAGLRALSSYRQLVLFDALTLFEQQAAPGHPWSAIGEYLLDSSAVIGRGGRELSFRLERSLDPLAASFLKSEWASWRSGASTVSDRAEPFVVLVHDEAGRGSLLGVALGLLREEHLVLERLIVARARRGEGIGHQLLGFVERFASDKDCVCIELIARTASEAPFFASRGFVVIAELTRRRAPQEVLMRRELNAAP